jgi:hypothetical protein
MMRERLRQMRTSSLAFAMAATVSAEETRTVSSFTVHPSQGGGTVDRTFAAGATALVSNNDAALHLTVKGSLLDLSTGVDVVNSSGSIVSGTNASITRRQGGHDTQIDISVYGLKDKPAGEYRIRIRYLVETNGPDIVKIRLLERGEITSITQDPSPALLGGTYNILNQTATFRVTGSGLAVATILPAMVANLNYTVVSRSNTLLVFSVRPTQAGRFPIIAAWFYDENLGHAPTQSDLSQIGDLSYKGMGSVTISAVGAPTVASITPQPATGIGSIVLSGSNFVGNGLAVRKIRFTHRYKAGTTELIASTSESPTTFRRNAGVLLMQPFYDIASSPLQLEFVAEEAVASGSPPLPAYTMSVPFTSSYSPSLAAVSASAEQPQISGVRIVRAGTMTFVGRYLVSFARQTIGRDQDRSFASIGTSFTTSAPTVTLGTQSFTITQSKHVAPSGSTDGVDTVRITLPDPADNVSGQFRLETNAGTTITPMFVLVTQPNVNLLSELATATAPEHVVTNQTLVRGRAYQLTGTSLSIKSLTQVIQTGAVRVGTRAMTIQPTSDPTTALRFVVPADATTGALVVSTAGGETIVGTFVVADPPTP